MPRLLLPLLVWAMSPALLAQSIATLPPLPIPDVEEYVDVDVLPQCINLDQMYEKFEYPLAAIKGRIEGRVYCRILIDEEGEYMDHIVLRSAHQLLSDEVELHLPTLEYSPAKRAGVPVKYWVNQYFSFDLYGPISVRTLSPETATHMNQRGIRDRDAGLAYLDTGLAHMAAGAYQKAAQDLAKSIRLMPRNRRFQRKWQMPLFQAHLHLGQAELALGHPTSARNHLTEAIGLRLGHAASEGEEDSLLVQARLMRAEAFLQLSEPLRALGDLNWISAQVPNNSPLQLHVMQSQAYTSLHDYEQALTCAARGREAHPHYAPAYLQQVRVLLLLGAQEAACELMHQAEALCTDQANRLEWLALLHESCPHMFSAQDIWHTAQK